MPVFASSITSNQPRHRVVSLVPSITETIITLGCADKLVGRTKFCIEPKGKVEHIPRIGGTKNIHTKEVMRLSPDLIIANKEENDREAVERLMKDFPVCVYTVADLDDALEMISHLGTLLDCTKQADGMCSGIRTEFEGLAMHSALRSAAYLIWDNPMMVAGGDTFIDHMMYRAGYSNVFGDEQRYPKITDEQLAEKSPSSVLLSSEPFPFKEKHIAKYREILPDADIRLVDGTYFSWYGSRLIDAPRYFGVKL